ncbi:MAG: peptide-binding protein [Candidatus Muiribacteriaceae bacterium]
MKRHRMLIMFFILIISLSFGCEKMNSEEPARKDRKTEAEIVPERGGYIVNAITRDAIILNPLFINDVSSMEIGAKLFEGLVRYDRDLNLVGVLAQSWEVIDQGLEIIFHLKKNVKWHDGNMFTAYDVKFTYDTIMKFRNFNESGVKSQLWTMFDYVKDVNVLDDHTVKVSYKYPYARTIEIWQTGILPKHIFGKYDSLKKIAESEFNWEPVGTGKYRMSKWIPDERIILEVNPDYHGMVPYIEKLIFTIKPDQDIIYLDTRLGKNDITELTSTQFGNLTGDSEFSKKIMPFRFTGNHYMFLAYNLDNPKFENPEVRRALTLAINREEIIEGVLEGYGRIAHGPFYEYSWAFNNDVKPLPYDPERASEMLREAGWYDSDGDGIIDRNGEQFVFTVLVDGSKHKRNMALKFIKRNLAEIGVTLNIEKVSWDSLIRDHIYPKQFEAFLAGWELGKDPDIFSIWHKDGPLNFISYNNETVNELLEKGRRTFDRNIRRQNYHEVHRLIMEDMPYTFLYIDDILGAVNRRIKGVEVFPNGLSEFTQWYVKYRTVIH